MVVLEKVLAEQALDFCILFSSVSSVLGGLQFGAYAAANLFMDAFVAEHNRRHPNWWCSVNWDTWQVYEGQHDQLGRTVAEFEMLPTEGVEALERVIANGPLTQVINSTGSLQARIDQWVRMVSVQQAGEDGETAVMHPRPTTLGAYVEPTNETEATIAEVWQAVLGIEPIGIYDHFLELGGHSLMAMQVISRLRQIFQVHMPLTAIFETPTVAEAALAVELAIIEELTELDDEEFEVSLAHD